MRRIPSRLLAIASAALMMTAATSHARTRPRYGDALRAETQAIAMSGDRTPEPLVGLVFETLVNVDDKGQLQPAIATSWTSSNGGRRWDFALRPGVFFHDGQICDLSRLQQFFSGQSSLSVRVRATGDRLIFESEAPQPDLPALLSLPRYAIYETTADGSVVGTGPFLLQKRSGATFSLIANDHYWGGRPYLDDLELVTSRNLRDQMNDFLLGRSDIAEISPDQWRRTQQERMRVTISKPSELVYLELDSSKLELRDIRIRQALSLCIDRNAIQSVIFQHQGEAAASLLPNWLSGYAFLFDPGLNIERARQLRAQLGPLPTLVISYDPGDAEGRLIAERVALNAHDAGLNLQAQPNGVAHADLRVRTIRLPSANATAALTGLIDQLGLPASSLGTTAQSLYDSERVELETYSVIPLVFVPHTTILRDHVRNWTASPDGTWHFDDVWLAKPRTEAAR